MVYIVRDIHYKESLIMEGKVVQFKGRDQNLIEFIGFLEVDGYLKLSCFNALELMGYDVTPNGVREFQENNGLEVTGKISVEDLVLMIQVFDNNRIQDIITHIDRLDAKVNSAKEENDISEDDIKKSRGLIYLYLLVMVFFFIYGIGCFWINHIIPFGYKMIEFIKGVIL